MASTIKSIIESSLIGQVACSQLTQWRGAERDRNFALVCASLRLCAAYMAPAAIEFRDGAGGILIGIS